MMTKKLVFYSHQDDKFVTDMAKNLSGFYNTRILNHDMSIQEYLSNSFDYLIVCNDYTFFLKMPINAKKVYIWKTPLFNHPNFAGVDLSVSFLLENLVYDGIIEGNVTPERLRNIISKK